MASIIKQKQTKGEKRDRWDNKVQSFFALIGYAVGVSNFWRFPYLCQKNGGGTFLIPYFTMALILGVPLTYLELLIGQKYQLGPLSVWGKLNPYARGIGVSIFICCCIGCCYYAVILGYALFYMANSFQSPLPWSECPRLKNGSNFTHALIDPRCSIQQPAVFYFYDKTLHATHTIEESGGLYWRGVIALGAAWIVLFLCLMRGIRSSGKVVYVTVTLPYVFLVAFLIRGLTLPGHENGLIELIRPNMTELGNPFVWRDAAVQIFYSVGIGFGCYITLGSYNPPNMKTFNYAISIVTVNALTSILSAVVVFSILGVLSTQVFHQCLTTINVDPATINGTEYGVCSMRKILLSFGSGPGLAFVVFSTILQQLNGAPAWSAIFFLMLFTLGIDSLFGIVEAASTSLRDLRIFSKWPKELVVAILCGIYCGIGLIFVQRSGSYFLEMVDQHAISITLLIIAICECIGIALHDAVHRADNSRTIMSPTGIGLLPKIIGCILVSVAVLILTLAVIITSFGMNPQFTYHVWTGHPIHTEPEPYPGWLTAMAILLMCVSVLPIPIVAIFTPICRRICQRRGSVDEEQSIEDNGVPMSLR